MKQQRPNYSKCYRPSSDKSKGNVDLYSASSRTPLTRSDGSHSVTCKQYHYLPLLVSIPQAAPPCIHAKRSLSFTYYSFIDPKRMNG